MRTNLMIILLAIIAAVVVCFLQVTDGHCATRTATGNVTFEARQDGKKVTAVQGQNGLPGVKNTTSFTILNPYRQARANVYPAQFHNHSTGSDGHYTPAQIVDMYTGGSSAVSYSGQAYTCIKNHDATGGTILPTNTEYWTNTGAAAAEPAWADESSYYTGVTRPVSVMAITDHTDSADPEGGTVTTDPGGHSILFIQGTEESRSTTHIIATWATEGYADSLTPTFQEIVDSQTADGALTWIAHANDAGIPASQDDIDGLDGILGQEVYNSQVAPKFAEDKWDAALTAGKRLWAFCADDYHYGVQNATTGTAAESSIMVFADTLDSASIKQAIIDGNFYASMLGAEITSIDLDASNLLTITASQTSDIHFYGKGGVEIGSACTAATSCSYAIQGDEGYVRAEVVVGSQKAWTNPVWIPLVGKEDINQTIVTADRIYVDEKIVFPDGTEQSSATVVDNSIESHGIRNLLPNGDFSDGLTGWVASAAATLTVDTGVYHSPTYPRSLKVVDAGAPYAATIGRNTAYEYVGVNTGDTVTMSAWVYAPGVSGVHLRMDTAGGSASAGDYYDEVTGGWQLLSVTHVVDGTSDWGIQLYNPDTSGLPAYFSEVMLTHGTEVVRFAPTLSEQISNGISAAAVALTDTAGNYESTTVEGAFSEIPTIATNKASDIINPPHNGMTNGDFLNWTGSLPDGYAKSAAAVVTEETTIVHGGFTRSAKVVGGALMPTTGHDWYGLTSGDTITIGVWVYINQVGGTNSGCSIISDMGVNQTTTYSATAGDWNFMTQTFVNDEPAGTWMIQFWANGDEECYWSEVTMVEGSSALTPFPVPLVFQENVSFADGKGLCDELGNCVDVFDVYVDVNDGNGRLQALLDTTPTTIVGTQTLEANKSYYSETSGSTWTMPTVALGTIVLLKTGNLGSGNSSTLKTGGDGLVLNGVKYSASPAMEIGSYANLICVGMNSSSSWCTGHNGIVAP